MVQRRRILIDMSENDLAEYNEYMKELNEVVKVDDLIAYTSLKRLLDTHANLIVVQEFENLLDMGSSKLSKNLKKRINQLKQ